MFNAKKYYLGNRNLGFIALSMSIFATYVSSGTYLAGFGQAFSHGYMWFWISSIQIISIVYIFYLIQDKLLIFSKQYDAITVPQLLDSVYKSKLLGMLSALVIIFFVPFILVAQWQGGAHIVASLFNLDYKMSMVLFALFVGVYTIMGGFKSVVLTDVVQGFIMLIGSLVIILGIIDYGGGLSSITQTLINLGNSFSSSLGHNQLHPNFILSFWALVGIGLIGLPQNIVRFMAFKDKRSFNSAMIITPIIIFFIMFTLNFGGIYSHAVISEFTGSKDQLLLVVIDEIFGEFVTIFLIVAIFSSIISTADSLLIMAVSTIFYDLLYKYFKVYQMQSPRAGLVNQLGGLVFLSIVTFIAIDAPKEILTISFIGFGALQTMFFVPTLFMLLKYPLLSGKKVSFIAAFNMLFYIWMFYFKPSFMFGLHAVVFSLSCSLIMYLLLLVYESRFVKK